MLAVQMSELIASIQLDTLQDDPVVISTRFLVHEENTFVAPTKMRREASKDNPLGFPAPTRRHSEKSGVVRPSR